MKYSESQCQENAEDDDDVQIVENGAGTPSMPAVSIQATLETTTAARQHRKGGEDGQGKQPLRLLQNLPLARQ